MMPKLDRMNEYCLYPCEGILKKSELWQHSDPGWPKEGDNLKFEPCIYIFISHLSICISIHLFIYSSFYLPIYSNLPFYLAIYIYHLSIHILSIIYYLFQKLLHFDPKKRLTAAEALAHPYFADYGLSPHAPTPSPSSSRSRRSDLSSDSSMNLSHDSSLSSANSSGIFDKSGY